MLDTLCGRGDTDWAMFWSALAAIGTLTAVVTAIWLHLSAEKSRKKADAARQTAGDIERKYRCKNICIQMIPLLNDLQAQVSILESRLKTVAHGGMLLEDPVPGLRIWGLPELTTVLSDATSLPATLSNQALEAISWARLININLERVTTSANANYWVMDARILKPVYLNLFKVVEAGCINALTEANAIAEYGNENVPAAESSS